MESMARFKSKKPAPAPSLGCPFGGEVLGAAVEPPPSSAGGGALLETGGNGGSATSLSSRIGLGAIFGGKYSGVTSCNKLPGWTGLM